MTLDNIWHILLLFFIPVLAGLSAFIFPKDKLTSYTEYIKLFGASFFLGVIVMHLLPEVFHEADRNVGLFVALGFFVQVLIESFTGSEPHDHVLPETGGKYSIALLIGLAIHSFIEGFPLAGSYDALHHHHHVDDTYLAGVLMHKVPVIIILVLMMLTSGISKRSAVLQIVIFSLMTPLGLLIGEYIPSGSKWSLYILAFVVGSISHIAMHLIISRDIKEGKAWDIGLKIALMVLGFMGVYLL